MGREIQRIIREWKKESKTTRVIQFQYKRGILTIYTSQPGWLIGRRGVLVDKYFEIFKKELLDLKELKFEETDYYWV